MYDNTPNNSTPNEETQANSIAKKASKSEATTHPVCQDASDPEKCKLFAERLDEASNNIDSRREA